MVSTDFIPDLRRVTRAGTSFLPSFGLSKESLDRVTPKNLFPDFGKEARQAASYIPKFSGISFNPSNMLAGTGMESLMQQSTAFMPSFGRQSSTDFLLPGMGQGYTTLDDILRQHGIGQYAPVVPQQGGYPSGGGMADLGDHPLNQYDQLFLSAGQSEGVDPLLLKAIAYVEHGWDQPISPHGAAGIMQLMPNWESELGIDRMNPQQNILGGAKVLKIKFGEGDGTWQDAVARYHGYGSDGYTTHQQYVAAVWDWYGKLKAAAQQQTPGGGANYTGGGSGLASVFGGTSFGISQEIGGHAMDYSYGIGLGVGNGHPGIDIAAPYGTKAYFPTMGGGVTGTVVYNGGTGYFRNDGGDYPGAGELRIQLSNGDIIIYGHMSNIAVRPGQLITVGTYLGQTGTAGSGAHLHLEYRKRGGCPDGYCAIDPRNVIGY